MIVESLTDEEIRSSRWARPLRWITRHQLQREFWKFFGAAFFFDAGFVVYYFLFNLYLVDMHLSEKAIGWITGTATLGSMLITLPAGLAGRRWGVKPVMITCFVAAPCLSILRVLLTQEVAQIPLALLAGGAVGLWGVCYLPAVTRLTSEDNRATAFGLIFSVSVGTGALGTLLCGYAQSWMVRAGWHLEPYMVKRLLLIGAASLAAVGLPFVLSLQFPDGESADESSRQGWQYARKSRFLRVVLPLMALSAALAATVSSFGPVYLSRGLALPMQRIGILFSISQIFQLFAGMLSAPLFRLAGLQNGISITQVITAALLLALALMHGANLSAIVLIVLIAVQWMSSPGLYNMLMSRCPDHEQSSVASYAMFLNALVTSGVIAVAGSAILWMGYRRWFAVLSLVALLIAGCMRVATLTGDRKLSA